MLFFDIYVDGSYRDGRCGIGAVVKGFNLLKKFFFSVESELALAYQNVYAEVIGAIFGMVYAYEKGAKKVSIYHDLDLIGRLAFNNTKAPERIKELFINRKPEDSILYKVEMNGLIKT